MFYLIIILGILWQDLYLLFVLMHELKFDCHTML